MNPQVSATSIKQYWNNSKIEALIASHKAALADWEAGGRRSPKPAFPDELALAFLTLAERISLRPGFQGYSFRRDMVAQALLTLMLYWDRFDPAKGTAFNFYSRCVFNAFVKYINRERRISSFNAQVSDLARHHGITLKAA